VKSAVIIANGRFRPSAGLREVVAAADVVICADGGLRHARTLGRAPHIVVGDFDSVPPRLLAWAERRGAELRQHPTAKDKTDTELALDAAVAWGARLVDFLAVMGGRPDHALANLFLLVAARRHGVRSRIHDGRRLLGVGARPHSQIVLGRRDPQLPEECLGHRVVVVLPGVDHDVPDRRAGQRARHGRELHEIGTRAND